MANQIRQLVELYNYANYEIEDPRVSEWFLMGSPIKIVLFILTYLYIVKVAGPKYMKHRQAYDMKKVIALYNVFQIFANIYVCNAVYTAGWNGKFTLGCEPIDYSDDADALRMVTAFWYFLMLKLFDFIETGFFVLRKKNNQISFLHVYHHVTTMVYAWMACKWIAGGMVSFTVIPNTLVHAVMYTYYLLTLFGPSMQKRISSFKKFLTFLQMVQFWIIVLHSLQVFRPGCSVPRLAAYVYIPNIIIFFYLFYDFYKKTYTTKVHGE